MSGASKKNKFRDTENTPSPKSCSGSLATLRNYITLMALSLALCEFYFISGFEGEVNGAVKAYIN